MPISSTPGGVRDGLTRLLDAGVDAITTGFVFAENTATELAAEYGAPYLHAMASQAQAEVVANNRSRYRNIFQVCPTEAHYEIGFLRLLDRLTAQRSSGRIGWPSLASQADRSPVSPTTRCTC